MREWTPGDVAVVCNEYGVWNVAICTLRATYPGYWWRFGVADSWLPVTANARPLVVIDPEDREQVERLMALLKSQDQAPEAVDIMQAALREFANPTLPKPDEPTGLGAVVEDVDGYRWVYSGGPQPAEGQVWFCHNLNGTALYREIDVVRVLSEGVA